MKILGFGQRTGQIVKTAYVVQDMHAAIDWWIHDGSVGTRFLLDSFTGPEQRYRGEPNKADVGIAMAFAGHMMIELILPKDAEASVDYHFFLQAEDGIRDTSVTGVQTCALPI